MENKYIVPAETRIGHVHLKVSNLDRSLVFYHDLLGFEIMSRYGDSAVFISAGGYHHHIALNTWHSKDAPPAPRNGVGLYHTAIVYPTRKDLAVIYDRLIKAGFYGIKAIDHGVSEALYLNDPDNNGIELYWDKPKDLWEFDEDGSLMMVSNALDLQNFLNELEN
jgi:catechol 2,3-dioxygenase